MLHEPLVNEAQERVDAIAALANEIATDLECGRKVECPENAYPRGVLQWSDCVAICVWCGLDDELQQFINGTRSKSSLCHEIALHFDTQIFDWK